MKLTTITFVAGAALRPLLQQKLLHQLMYNLMSTAPSLPH